MKKFNEFVNEDFILKNIDRANKYDIFYKGADSFNGWKLSILGKTVEDSKNVYSLLKNYLKTNNIMFKVGTSKRVNHSNYEQSKKIMTIYVPDNSDHLEIAEDVYKLLSKYKGHENLKTPFKGYEHYAGPVFFRNDRDEMGQYIPTGNL